MTTGQKIKAVRLRRGITLRTLGRMIEVHFTTIDKLENGKMRPTMAHVQAIAKALGVPTQELHADNGEASPVADLVINGILQPPAVFVNGVRYSPESTND